MDRRTFLRNAVVASGGAVALPTVAMATGAGAQAGGAAGPYGSIDGQEPDENGLLLPAGFTSRIIAIAGEPVGETGYQWPPFPDGAATFDDGEGGWYLAVNSEVLIPTDRGGASSIRMNSDGEVTEAFSILDGTTGNCAGGPTPWGTWLSCEESGDNGQVWETDPTGADDAVAHPAMGQFNHEAAAVILTASRCTSPKTSRRACCTGSRPMPIPTSAPAPSRRPSSGMTAPSPGVR
jgi:secreted PhoX family phosphatase